MERDKWLNLGIQGGCCWPTKDTKINFGGLDFLLKPATINTEQSIHVNFGKGRISQFDAISLVNRFLSILSWCDGNRKGMDVIYRIGVPDSQVPRSIPFKSSRITGSSIAFPFFRNIEKDPNASLALALYREGLVTDSIPLSFLSFFKIINVFYSDKNIIEGLKDLLPYIKYDLAKQRITELKKSVKDIPEYLYKRRCATAHAFIAPTIDPDNFAESRDLSQDTWIIREIADYLIEKKLGVSKSILG